MSGDARSASTAGQENSVIFISGMLRVALVVMVALLLVALQIPSNLTGAYLAVAVALAYGAALALGRPKWLFREGLAGVLIDALTITLLVRYTGGEGSLFTPLYLLAALGLVRVRGVARISGGTAALVLGYLVGVAAPERSFEVLLSPAAGLGSGLVVLVCIISGVAGSYLRDAREKEHRYSLDLAAERKYAEEVGSLVLRAGPVLTGLSAEDRLRWAAEGVCEALEVPYAHVTTSDGALHRTAVRGDGEVYPSWWHPEIQRLVLWSCRTGEVIHSEAEIHDMEGFVAVPLISEDGANVGAIVAGGRRFDAEDERALRLLAVPVASVLSDTGDSPGGLDLVSGAPNQDSLNRVLRRELSQDRPLTLTLVSLDRLNQSILDRGPAARDSLLYGIGQRLKEARYRVFRWGDSAFAVLSRESSSAKARAFALKIRHIVEEAAGSAGPVAASSGFVVAERGQGEPESLLDAAWAALKEAHSRSDRVCGTSLGDGYREDEAPGRVDGGGLRGRQIVRILEEAIEVRDPDLGEHSRAVSGLAQLIGSRMSLSAKQMETLAVGGLLHDLGKIGLPDHILQKPSALSAKEFETVKLHPELGVRILALAPELSSVVPAVRYHHERFDGRGYPEGLQGKDTPLAARIIFVADALDSMVQDRIYRPGRSRSEALEEIARNSGTQFDPEVVRALQEAMAEPDDRQISL